MKPQWEIIRLKSYLRRFELLQKRSRILKKLANSNSCLCLIDITWQSFNFFYRINGGDSSIPHGFYNLLQPASGHANRPNSIYARPHIFVGFYEITCEF